MDRSVIAPNLAEANLNLDPLRFRQHVFRDHP